ncbi:MAG: hypothetical protein PHP68_02950 [Oscillospiraceae bacterium]|nr:hypothetical protein [Oscillospiraceae bacterium]
MIFMAAYVGILSNSGKVLDNDTEALVYAFERCGIEPTESWLYVDEEFGEIMLEWFFSRDWIRYRHINDIP